MSDPQTWEKASVYDRQIQVAKELLAEHTDADLASARGVEAVCLVQHRLGTRETHLWGPPLGDLVKLDFE